MNARSENKQNMSKMNHWNYDTCYEEASKYKSRVEFQRNNGYAYKVAAKNGWLDDYTWFAPSETAKKWNYETCYEEAMKYKSRTEFNEKAKGAYGVAVKNGWINNYSWFEDGVKKRAEKRRKWNYETCKEEAKKYKSRKEFHMRSSGAYNVAYKNGWLDDYTWFDKLWEKKWNYETCKEEAKKYKTKIDFRKLSGGAYDAALKNGWLDDYTWLQRPSRPNQAALG